MGAFVDVIPDDAQVGRTIQGSLSGEDERFIKIKYQELHTTECFSHIFIAIHFRNIQMS